MTDDPTIIKLLAERWIRERGQGLCVLQGIVAEEDVPLDLYHAENEEEAATILDETMERLWARLTGLARGRSLYNVTVNVADQKSKMRQNFLRKTIYVFAWVGEVD